MQQQLRECYIKNGAAACPAHRPRPSPACPGLGCATAPATGACRTPPVRDLSARRARTPHTPLPPPHAYPPGVNHFEVCKDLRESLWKKMHTPNYGAPGPARSSAKYV